MTNFTEFNARPGSPAADFAVTGTARQRLRENKEKERADGKFQPQPLDEADGRNTPI